MCGIAGLIFDELQPDGPAWLTAMTQSMFHRGPDGGGAVAFGLGGRPVLERRLGRPEELVQWDYLPMQVGLGARRLAILDLTEAGHQPMSGGGGQAWLAFNGAIYNHGALRDELRAAGMTFIGRGDTEVVLAAYRHWGPAAFSRLEGMWALAIYEPAAGRVVLCRDRMGIKPLHVARLGKGLAFASEIKALLAVPGFMPDTEASLLRDFLTRGLVDHTERTMFEGMWSVPPGCWLAFDLRGGQGRAAGTIGRYDAERDAGGAPSNEARGGSATGSADMLRGLLEAAVAAHLVSDVPVGSCLSGGIDSSAIVALAYRLRQADPAAAPHWSQHTFTAVLPDTGLDERRYAEAVLARFPGLTGTMVAPRAEQLAEQMMSLVWHQEQPFGSPSVFLQWEVMRAARAAGVKVLLDGQGADELFCGYEGYVPALLADLLARGKVAAFFREWTAARRAGWFGRAALASHTAAQLAPQGLRDRWRDGVLRGQCRWLAGELFDAGPSPGIAEGLGLRLTGGAALEKPGGSGLFGEFWRRQLFQESLPSLLRFEDRNSMAYSIEARVPFLDRQMVTFAAALEPGEKIRHGVLKSVLRDAAGPLLPSVVRERRDKIGFAAPTAAWMRGALGDWWREAVRSKKLRERGCFSEKGVAALADRFDAGDDGPALVLWRIALVETWARRFMDR
ncbi:MAG: asparagine synthase (glutamine-hydrolyzing) [Planctomycetota bacterium]|nr:MAG: asparagine synthase (glutamine-hydrolyzing) [Planctomycetota bacterium]